MGEPDQQGRAAAVPGPAASDADRELDSDAPTDRASRPPTPPLGSAPLPPSPGSAPPTPPLGSAPIDPLLGQELPGRFRIVRLLGEGAYGLVYLAEQEGAGRRAVVKVLKRELLASVALARFEREARVLASLGHHHLVRLYVADRLPDGRPFLAMEYGGDRTLRDEILRLGRLPPARALHIAAQICDALEEAHTHATQVVHRDLKPANVMLSEKSGRDFVKVVDMGLARLLEPEDALDDVSTSSSRGMPLGTPAFYSPEQARGAQADARSDLYALGCVLFQMLTGSSPYKARTLHEYIHAHCYEAPAPLEQFEVRLPEVQRVISRALEKDPEARYQSAAELREALQAAARGLSTWAPASGAVASTPPGALTTSGNVTTPVTVSSGSASNPGTVSGPGTSSSPGAASAPVDAALAELKRLSQSISSAPPPRADPGRIRFDKVLLLVAVLAALALLGSWLSPRANRAGGPAADLASAQEAAARHDFKSALLFGRRAGGAAPATLLDGLAREAEAQEQYERLERALQARDADAALALSRGCPAPGTWFCGQAAGQQAKALALFSEVHLAAARALKDRGAAGSCLAEVARVQAVAPADAAALALARDCTAPSAGPAVPAAAGEAAAASPARPRSVASSTPARGTSASPGAAGSAGAVTGAAPASAAPASAATDSVAGHLLDEALLADKQGDTGRATALLLDAERLKPSAEVLGRVYKNLLVVSLRRGDQAQTCSWLARYRPLAAAGEDELLARLAKQCGGAPAADQR